jgi:predicted dithiol-disulfide oxidoreductase (DUF899 family)
LKRQPSCAALLDQLDGAAEHAGHHINLAVVAKAPPSGAVTASLRQRLRAGMRPPCRVAHKADREYIWHLFDEGADQKESIERFRRACGFCGDRVEMLRPA